MQSVYCQDATIGFLMRRHPFRKVPAQLYSSDGPQIWPKLVWRQKDLAQSLRHGIHMTYRPRIMYTRKVYWKYLSCSTGFVRRSMFHCHHIFNASCASLFCGVGLSVHTMALPWRYLGVSTYGMTRMLFIKPACIPPKSVRGYDMSRQP